jgi:hypothetical protein
MLLDDIVMDVEKDGVMDVEKDGVTSRMPTGHLTVEIRF